MKVRKFQSHFIFLLIPVGRIEYTSILDKVVLM